VRLAFRRVVVLTRSAAILVQVQVLTVVASARGTGTTVVEGQMRMRGSSVGCVTKAVRVGEPHESDPVGLLFAPLQVYAAVLQLDGAAAETDGQTEGSFPSGHTETNYLELAEMACELRLVLEPEVTRVWLHPSLSGASCTLFSCSRTPQLTGWGQDPSSRWTRWYCTTSRR
jgi:hypothetical protein